MANYYAHPSAEIAEGVTIGRYAMVSAGAVVWSNVRGDTEILECGPCQALVRMSTTISAVEIPVFDREDGEA